MCIRDSSDSPVSATSVSNTFIDEYMSDANGEFVKIYLYLLRLDVYKRQVFTLRIIRQNQIQRLTQLLRIKNIHT